MSTGVAETEIRLVKAAIEDNPQTIVAIAAQTGLSVDSVRAVLEYIDTFCHSQPIKYSL